MRQPITTLAPADRKVYLKYTSTSGQTIPASDTIILFNNKIEASHSSAYNMSTGLFTPPKNDWYNIHSQIVMEYASWATNQWLAVRVYKNSTMSQSGMWVIQVNGANSYANASVQDGLYLTTNDTLSIRGFAERGNTALMASGTYVFFTISSQS